MSGGGALQYTERNCAACGGTDHREVFSWSTSVRGRTRDYVWHIRNVVCTSCGFSFVTPAPTVASLDGYYADSFALHEGASVGSRQRLAFLAEIQAPLDGGSVVEIGGNRRGEFWDALRPKVASYVNCEPNIEAKAGSSGLAGVVTASADLALAYYVFEHVADLAGMLRECRRALKAGGTLVVEVPDLSYYPRMAEGLSLHEHVNHFSLRSLSGVMSRNGFDLQAATRRHASRPFGFAAAFRPSDTSRPKLNVDVVDATAFMAAGKARVGELWSARRALLERISLWAGRNEKLVFWGANDLCKATLEAMPSIPQAVLVDANRDKAAFVDGYPALLPDAARNAIGRADRVIIFANTAAQRIARGLSAEFGRDLARLPVMVIDFGAPSGLVALVPEEIEPGTKGSAPE